MQIVFYIYLALLFIMSVVALISYQRDKTFAKQGKYRVPERTLLLLAACFGGIGAFAAMRVFRHKTKHLRFQIIVPLSMVIQLAVLVALAYFAFLTK